MKKLLPITLAIFFGLTAFGQLQIKEINEFLVKVNETLYASKYEVSNELYMTFLNSLEDKNLLSIAQIDTLKWNTVASHNESYAQYYHAHPAYQNYPVVNISYEASVLFCEWLTKRYNSDKKRKFNKVTFRLPSEEEWIASAQAGDESAIYPWKGPDLRNKSDQVMCNFKQEIKASIAPTGKQVHNDITAPVKSYWKNSLGLYNMSGNVAEMINEKGTAKGGSWKQDSEYLKINSKYNYDGSPQPYVGFRFFAEIIEK